MNRKVLFLSVLSVLTFIQAYPQQIKYINRLGEKVNKSEAEFYLQIYKDSVTDKSILIKKFSVDDKLLEAGYFKKGDLDIRNGITKEYNDLGNIKNKISWKDNNLNGELIGYYNNGQIRRIENYENGNLVNERCLSTTGSDTAFFHRIVSPTFKGEDINKAYDFIQEAVVYPQEAIEKFIQGVVYVSFCIDTKDQICDIKIIRSDNQILNESALKAVIKTYGFWKCGYEEGKKTAFIYNIPISYALR